MCCAEVVDIPVLYKFDHYYHYYYHYYYYYQYNMALFGVSNNSYLVGPTMQMEKKHLHF